MSTHSLWIDGRARPQGSKKHVGNGRMVEAVKGLKQWRRTVTQEAISTPDAPPQPLTAPIELIVRAYFKRPPSHFKRDGTLNKQGLKYPIPNHACGDSSKILRAIEDALTDAGWWADDADLGPVHCERWWDDEDYVRIEARQL